MSSNGRRTSSYDVIQWLKTLYNAGHTVYYHCELPEELKNESYQKAAARMGLLIPTGNKDRKWANTKEWRIPDTLMTCSHCHPYRWK